MELFGISEFRNDLEILQNLQRKMISILSYIKSEISTSNYINDLFQYFEEISISQHFSLYEAFLRIFVHLSIYFNFHETKDEENVAKRQDILFIILRELILKHSLKKSINQLTLFLIFKQNQHLLFFLYEEGIFSISFLITKIAFRNKNLFLFFHSEIKKFNPILYERLKQQIILQNEYLYANDQLQEEYSIIEDEKENITEILKRIHSQNQIATIIRSDDVNRFIDFISHKDNFNLNSRIKPSLYENNPDINNKWTGISLLEYSMAFGSINIFRYLWLNKVEYSQKSLLYSIIGNNYEIIHLLEEVEVIEEEEVELIEEEIQEESKLNFVNKNYLKSIEYYRPEFIEYFFDTNNSTKINNLPLSSIINIFNETTNIEILCEIFLNGKISQLSRSEEHRYLPSLNNHISTFNINILNLPLSPFYFICYFLFQQPNIDINSKNNVGYTPLHKACSGGYYEIVELLLKQPKIDINSKNNDGYTPLHKASSEGHFEIVELLLKQPNIDINSKDNYGYTPLHKASSGGYYETAELLLKQPNIDINSKDKYGYTPLYEACYGGYYEIVELLLKQPNIDINSKDKHGCTPLHKACSEGHFEIVELLLKQPNIDINSKDKNGKTPYDIA